MSRPDDAFEATTAATSTEQLRQQRDAALQQAQQLKSGLLRLRIRRRWLSVLVWIRRTQLHHDVWPPGVILAAAIFSGLAALLLIHQITGGLAAGLSAAVLVAGGIAFGLYVLFYRMHVVVLQQERDRLQETISSRRSAAIDSLADALDVHRKLDESQSLDAATGRPTEITYEQRQAQRRQQQLLNRDWRELDSESFSDFIIDVVEAHGFEITAAPSDQSGIRLLMESADRVYAVATVARPGTLHPKRLSRIAQGASHYPVDALLIISNLSADQAARSRIVDLSAGEVPVALIDAPSLPDLVAGRLQL